MKGQEEQLRAATAEVLQVYRQNFFPEMRVNWQAYPDNIGHKEFPGCFRCHDGKHVSADGRVIRRDCGTCHDFLEKQRSGDLVLVGATPAFGHPWKLGGKHAEIRCGACHDGGPAKPAICRECHKIPASGAPMTGMACKECHVKEQQRQPLTDCKSCHGTPAGLHKAAMHAAAGCTACHVPHAWSPEPRKQCLTCHTDKLEHNPGPPCAQCHTFRSVAASGKGSPASGPAAISFPADPGSPGPVTFIHTAHLARGAKCADCHPKLFKMQRGGVTLNMNDMAEGKACGTCHNGQKAFGVMDGDKCATCHKT
jgi:c(7)-type cytochrome triheme protein